MSRLSASKSQPSRVPSRRCEDTRRNLRDTTPRESAANRPHGAVITVSGWQAGARAGRPVRYTCNSRRPGVVRKADKSG